MTLSSSQLCVPPLSLTLTREQGAHEAGEFITTAEHHQKMVKAMSTLTSRLLQCDPSKPLPILTYMSPPAQPARNDPYTIKFADRRTNGKIRYWASLIGAEATKLGWRYVDAFEKSIAFMEDAWTVDYAHYLFTDALDPILDELILKMEICIPPPSSATEVKDAETW